VVEQARPPPRASGLEGIALAMSADNRLRLSDFAEVLQLENQIKSGFLAQGLP